MERQRTKVVVARIGLALILIVLLLAASCAKPTPPSQPAPAPAPTPGPTPTPTPEPTRQEKLEAAAKEEGKVVFWGSHAQYATDFLSKFQERYPWLEIEFWKESGTTTAEKIISESMAGVHNCDVFGVGEEVMMMMPPDLLAKYDWPNTATWPSETFPESGLYFRISLVHFGVLYNSEKVSAADVPTAWEDIKDPKWKGQTVAPLGADEAALMLAAMWGEKEGKLDWERSFDFWRQVFQNTEPAVNKGYSGTTKLLGAGEWSIEVYCVAGIGIREKLVGGLPIEVAPFPRLPARPLTWAILKDAPHPNAARLLADYITTLEGSTMFADTVLYPSTNPGAKDALPNRVLAEKGTEIYSIPMKTLFTDENVKKSTDFWKEMCGL